MKNFKSKKVVSIILCFFILLGVTKSFAQEDKKAMSLFEEQVNKFEKFFSSNPKLLVKQSYHDSPTGYIFFYERFDDYKISYDIKKSDSLVSPYIGYLTVSHLETTSKKCGDFKGYGDEKYFSTIELSRQKKEDKSCYKPLIVGGTEVRLSSKFIFAFQKEQWVYKDVVNDYNEPDSMFYAAFGKSDGRWFCVEDNDFWKKLIE